ncbi:MAG: hypothetical protein J4472_03260 [DPANN group archaeon]|nr:hypothetical protein [DPANN group archaeon]
MALIDIFKRKKKNQDFIDIGPQADEGSYGPAQEGREPLEELPEEPRQRKSLNELGAMSANETPLDLLARPNIPEQPLHPSITKQDLERDIQEVSIKIDNLRTTLDTINARLINIENAVKGESKTPAKDGEGWTY